ncbi:hypothetical protein FS749_001739 [Ceratobasidium sp. UAMH 11750]|nr:hypothetical protein FS749_001739 [Ceratobasidium sp. UAMH 11750]
MAVEGATEHDRDYDPNQDLDRDNDSEDKDAYVSQTIIDGLERLVSHNMSHLSNCKIKELLKAILQTQATTLETQGELAKAVAKSFAGVGLVGRDHSSNRPQLTWQDTTHPPVPQKRHILTTSISLPTGKEDDSVTQSESEEENWNTHHCPDTSDSNSDSNTKSQPPTTIS